MASDFLLDLGGTQVLSLTGGALDQGGHNLTVSSLSLNSKTDTESGGVLKVNGATVGVGALFGGTVAL